MDNLTRFDSHRNGCSIVDVEIKCGLKWQEGMNIISAILALFGHRTQQRALHVIERVLRHEKVNELSH